MQWDVFCQVVDNHGDAGVCWRLAAELARRGDSVRLWIDAPEILRWMAPQGEPGVAVLPWDAGPREPGDVVVEAFGCNPPPAFVAAMAARQPPPAWINLEYLSAERYVERSHGLPSPVQHGPGAGLTKWFFFPGFTPRTGGLLREADLRQRQQAFDAGAWLARRGCAAAGVRTVSLFCYEPPALPQLLLQLAAGDAACQLLVTAGRATAAVEVALAALPAEWNAGGRLRLHFLPLMSQVAYDELLWSCDLNFVRGEDSLVRGLLAGRPFVWQAYPQQDGVHAGKLEAFLAQVDAPEGLRRFHRAWNAGAGATLPALDLEGWAGWARAAQARAQALPELATSLQQFVRDRGRI